MKVADGTVVRMDYTLRSTKGQVLDESGDEPLTYLHGHGNIVPGLEKALTGLEVGASTRAQVPAAEAYGVRDDERILQVPRTELPQDVEPKPGMVLSAQTPDGQNVPLWVTEVQPDMVTLDGNHPLAGQDLDFEVTIREVRSATSEEMSHGHVDVGVPQD